jgi:hypothetical protein
MSDSLATSGPPVTSESSVATKPVAALESLASGMLRLVEELHRSFSQQIGRLAEQLYSFLIGGSYPKHSDSAGTERAPPPGQTPLPASPGNSPVSVSLSGSGSSFGSGGISLLLGVLASFSILLQGGRFSWLSRELLKPNLALHLAIERPG